MVSLGPGLSPPSVSLVWLRSEAQVMQDGSSQLTFIQSAEVLVWYHL